MTRSPLEPIIVTGLICLSLVTMAAAGTITVTNTADSGSGSLRAAIAAAGNNDTINFALTYPATITLTSGELLISGNLIIFGPGATQLTVSGNSGSRVFHIGMSNAVTISGLTISNGVVSAGNVGAGIYIDTAMLSLTNCVVHNNHANGGSTAHGAGIYGFQSNIAAVGCVFDSNVAAGNGGGVYNNGSTLTIDRSTVTGNSALSGGGIFNRSGTITATNDLVYLNTATNGGGISNDATLGVATLTLNNCTVSSNTVSGTGAAGSQIYNARQSATATISNSTIVSNNVAVNFSGGAVYNDNDASTSLGNTIIQASSQEHTIINAGTGTVMSDGYNLAFDNGNGLLTATGDQINTDPLLDIGTGPRDNGGPTFTIALKATSPAIDKGKRNAVSNLSAGADQRGEPRPFDDPAIVNAIGGDGSDIGAYEADLRLTNLVRAANDLQFSFTSIVGKTYQLQSRASLSSGNWNSFGNMASGNGGIAGLTATGAFGSAVQFYRVLQSP
jgi:hypothetical protein